VRILVVSREIPPVGGGAGNVALELAQRLGRRGHCVRILTMHIRGLPKHEERDDVDIHRLSSGRRHRDSAYLPSMLRFVMAGRRAARDNDWRPDIVHAHAIIPDGLIGTTAARAHACPLVITAHGSDVPGYDPARYVRAHRAAAPLWRRVVRRADAITTPSSYLADLIRGEHAGTKVNVIPNGIDLELFTESSDRSGFLIASRLIERKNYRAFFDALRSVPNQQHIRVVGEGPERAALERIAGDLAHRVEFYGWLDHGSSKWRRLYEESRYFVFPSLNENLPINLLEAQLAGMTVLASDVPGNREALGDCAIYFPDVTPAGIAATIADVLQSSQERLDELGARGRRRVRALFDWETVTDRFESAFRAAGAVTGGT